MIPYRNREQPYDHSKHDRDWVDYFITNPVVKWIDNEKIQDRFQEIYGAGALVTAATRRIVPENIDRNQVTNNNPLIHTWGGEENIKPQAITTGVPAWAQTLLDKLDLIEKKVDIAVDKIGVILG